MTEQGHTVWVCVDCYFAHVNGEASDDPSYTPDREPLSQLADLDVTAGLLWDQHAEDCTGKDDETDCECETVTFSWSACQGCGSTLGGSRHALTYWIAYE